MRSGDSTDSLIVKWRRQVIDSQGWRRRLLALCSGLVAVLALPPLHIVPALVPALTILTWLIEGARQNEIPSRGKRGGTALFRTGAWSAFAAGWWFGVGFFAAGLYWVSLSFLVDARQFAWMIPFALLGLSGGFAIHIGLSTWAAHMSARGKPQRLFVMIAVWWVVFEWVRGWLLTGFPWNYLGTVWTFSDAALQLASILGVLGLSLVTMLAAAAPALLGSSENRGRSSLVIVGGIYFILAIIWLGGAYRLHLAGDSYLENVRLRLVQPNIDQRDKWKAELRGRHLNNLMSLSEAKVKTYSPTHVIWPETAVPFFFDSSPAGLRAVSQVIPKGGALLTGARRRSGGKTTDGKNELTQLWNSFHVLSDQAQIVQTYDKHHLVPFGEYVPFRNIINVDKLTAGRMDFSPGPGPRILFVPGAPPVSPLICYEVIFAGKVAGETGGESAERPGWLLNVTNDAWFGTSSGPHQHFAAARLRSVEEGLPLVRVANTGISGVIDAYGRVKARSQLNERTFIDSRLPQSLRGPTFYGMYGDWGVFALMLVVILISIFPHFFLKIQRT